MRVCARLFSRLIGYFIPDAVFGYDQRAVSDIVRLFVYVTDMRRNVARTRLFVGIAIMYYLLGGYKILSAFVYAVKDCILGFLQLHVISEIYYAFILLVVIKYGHIVAFLKLVFDFSVGVTNAKGGHRVMSLFCKAQPQGHRAP